ncbi:group II intron reverse transcriptase/maturase [Mucilaginibacter ginsenosidivorax]|uniref:Group II intron reverse transcriptase/maturase n=1 Tax=Mucilaginibacter ginsenosidivorax TaxID=862126 RepID=A0A5B8VT35_9SPHI|nr:group II intron reverse transcriptase/maturase [Mucilaginibacter ginsenosidivorax]QEC74599.1 group II intron reverse transcriptase/maturase [Mucilaginibacter ginsenosidivorax]
MNVSKNTACAPSDKEVSNWNNIDWDKCKNGVRKLQARIVKAQKEGKHGKVKSLQWVLTHSYHAKALAVKRVTSNRGKNTAGVDQVIWVTPAEKLNAIYDLKKRGYKPQPLKRVNIKKSNGKLRPLGIPTLKDRAMQALYLMGLEPIAETTADKHSYGFRRERSTIDAISQSHQLLGRGRFSPTWVFEGDIKGCFDNISHAWLLENIPMDKTMLKLWLKCGFVFNGELFPTEDGTPQGGIISPTLSNMTLDGMERMLRAKFPDKTVNGKRYYSAVRLVRYADDFIVTGKTQDVLENEVKPAVMAFLNERGLILSEEKTKVTHIDEGFDFLGYNIRRYRNGSVLTKPSKDSVKKFLLKTKEIISSNKSAKQDTLIRLLNPVIAGWGNNFKHGVSSDIFQNCDHLIFQKLWRWCRRRHSNKGKRWVKDKYFQSIGNRNWCFTWTKKGTEAKNYLTLQLLSDIGISRNVKIQAEANPFDPTWQPYFDKRETYKMLQTLKGKKSLLNLWEKQKRKCPVCGNKIDRELPWGTCKSIVNHKVVHQLVHDSCRRSVYLKKRASL